MSRIDASSLLAMRSAILQQNAALQKAAGVGKPDAPLPVPGAAPAGETSFVSALSNALSEVNGAQAKSSEVTAAYERGETTDIAQVMLAREQASIGFQATLQVRNKLLAAYKDIMSMPV